MREKSKTLTKLQEFVTWIEPQAGQKVKCLWSNNRGEYDNNKSQAWFKKTGIQWEPTVAYAPNQNGISKWTNRILIERVQFVLYGKNLDITLWAKIANTIIHFKNWSLMTSLFPLGKTFYKA